MSGKLEYPEQTKAVYNIVRFLVDKKALGEDPTKVEMLREDRRSVMPCRKGFGELNLDQLEWARKEGTWWFIGPVTELKVGLKDKFVITDEEMALLERLAQDAGLKLTIY